MMDCGLTFEGFRSHFGIQNQPKIDQEAKLKSKVKKDANRIAKEAPKGHFDTPRPLKSWAWEGGRGKGKPFLEG